jgi:hypothetical protein
MSNEAQIITGSLLTAFGGGIIGIPMIAGGATAEAQDPNTPEEKLSPGASKALVDARKMRSAGAAANQMGQSFNTGGAGLTAAPSAKATTLG